MPNDSTPTPPSIEDMGIGDFDRDGRNDLIIAGFGVGLMILPNLTIDPSCPTDTAAPFGLVDVDDLFAVINAWGPCGGCAQDTVPPFNVVDIDDLFAVINTWGDCPGP